MKIVVEYSCSGLVVIIIANRENQVIQSKKHHFLGLSASELEIYFLSDFPLPFPTYSLPFAFAFPFPFYYSSSWMLSQSILLRCQKCQLMPFTYSSLIFINQAVSSCDFSLYGSSALFDQSASIMAPVTPSYCCPFNLPIIYESSSGTSSARLATYSSCVSSFSINQLTSYFSFSKTFLQESIALLRESMGLRSRSTRLVNSLKLTEVSLSSC